MKKKALVIGGTGQIGAYQCKLLLKKNYKVYVTTRKLQKENNLKKLNILKKINIIQCTKYSQKKFLDILSDTEPQEIYFYSGISNIPDSFKKKKLTHFSHYVTCRYLLDAILLTKKNPKIFIANSVHIFGNIKKKITLSIKKYKPQSPYAKAKLKVYLLAKQYRKKFKLKIFSGLFLNTESILRPTNYVITKICKYVSNIQNNKNSKLQLGNINISRDWGWCEEYVLIVWKLLQTKPDDFIIGTGKNFTLKYMLQSSFKIFNLDWKKHVIYNQNFKRKGDLEKLSADIKKTILKSKITPKIYGIRLLKKLINFYKKNSE